MIWSMPASPEAAVIHRRLRSLGVKGLDAVHLTEATLAGASAFVTNDQGLLKKRLKIKTATGVEAVTPEDVLSRMGRKKAKP